MFTIPSAITSQVCSSLEVWGPVKDANLKSRVGKAVAPGLMHCITGAEVIKYETEKKRQTTTSAPEKAGMEDLFFCQKANCKGQRTETDETVSFESTSAGI